MSVSASTVARCMRGKPWGRLATLLSVALALAAAVAGSAAAARDVSGHPQARVQVRSSALGDMPHPRGVVPRRGARPSAAAAARTPTLSAGATPSNGAINPQLLLSYHGGPVMHSHRIHAIFWAPPGFSFPAGYQSGVEAYLQDVALDSGKTSSPYGAISQYTDGGGAAQYNVTYGGSVLVTDSAPTPDPSCFDGSTCIMDYQLAIEAEAVRSAQGWNLGLGNQYVILTP